MAKKRQNHKKRRRFPVFLFLIAAFFSAVLLSGGEKEEESAYMMAETGVIAVRETFAGLFLYEETVVAAAAAGTFSTDFGAGDKIAAGERAGELKLLNDIHSEPVKTVVSPAAGIFSPTVDGWEALLSSDHLEDLDLGAVFQTYKTPKTRLTAFRHRGDPCFKVMDNKEKVYLLLALKDVCLTEKTVLLSLLGRETQGEVVFTKQYGEERYGLLALAPHDGYFKNREVTADCILSKEEGVVIAASAVTQRHGETGVYCLSRGNLCFCPVAVLAEDGNNVLVEGIEAGSCILRDAH